MAGKHDSIYYDAFVAMGKYACDAAKYLKSVMDNYHPDDLSEQMVKMHAIENDADSAKHVMTKNLAKEFITPIEREDILELASYIDTVIDKTEDVLLRFYMFNIREIRDDAKDLVNVLVKCTEATMQSIEELRHFRKSKTLQECLVEVNNLEEVGDSKYTEAVRHVFTDKNIVALEAAAWNQIFHYIEEVFDACEDVADTIESVIMKNS
jgi:predicted phosphate transport protein (TIGR00153 family)